MMAALIAGQRAPRVGAAPPGPDAPKLTELEEAVTDHQRVLLARINAEIAPLSAAEEGEQHLLALFGALAAFGLSFLEELAELGVAGLLGVLDVLLEPRGVGQAGLGEPQEVIVLVLGAGGFISRGSHVRHSSVGGRVPATIPPDRARGYPGHRMGCRTLWTPVGPCQRHPGPQQ